MQDNLFLGPDADARFTLGVLRAYEGTGTISAEKTVILNGITLSYGTGGQLRGKYRSGQDNLLSLSLTCRTRSFPQWQCLTIPLGAMNLTGAAALGIIARSSAPQSTVSRLTVRSGRDGDFVDQPFGKALVSFAAPSTHLDLIEIDKAANLPLQAQWRDLILFFRPGPLEIEILDLRFFVV
ncbi:hypothetical protein [Paracoccus actinidiae]|uniref:hypothetical protein n=1 Tax=Paracoccus actinidiae TaxID=3064531 RepID=UPI0027D2D590|nr:hypothetical protein [Paracoccus sp. M09]